MAICVILGSLSAALLHWHYRFFLNADTISYLEVSRKYAEGDWHDALNVIWSPLYPWMLVPVLAVFADQPLEALQAAHLVQLLCVLFALWAASKIRGMSGSLLGSVLFCAVVLVPVRYLTPDILVMALSFWVLARMTDELEDPFAVGRYAVTGAAAALAYLAKSYFALYFALLLILSWTWSAPSTRTRTRFIAYIAGFLLVAGPWIASLSAAKGRFTLGEAGTSNLLSHGLFRDIDETIGRVGGFVHLHELPFPTAMPEHYEPIPRFVGPYHVDLFHVARLLALNLSGMFFGYYSADFPLYWPLAAILIAALAIFCSPLDGHSPHGPCMFLLTAGLVGILLFLASHVETRYLAPFPALFMAALGCRLLGIDPNARQPLKAMLSTLGVLFWLFPFWIFINGLRSTENVSSVRGHQAAMIDWMRANGARYAVVGPTYDLGFPAWGARAQLIASVDAKGLTRESCQDVTQSLLRISADALVSAHEFASCGDWKSIPGTDWFYWGQRPQ